MVCANCCRGAQGGQQLYLVFKGTTTMADGIADASLIPLRIDTRHNGLWIHSGMWLKLEQRHDARGSDASATAFDCLCEMLML